MAKVVMHSQLALEQSIIRLGMIEEVGDVMVQMTPVAGVLNDIKGRLRGVIPEVSFELDKINHVIEGTITETGQVGAGSTEITVSDAEAQKVLEEVEAISEIKLKEKFPDLPTVVTAPKGRAREALTVGGGSNGVESRVDGSSIEEKVYDYIKLHNGDLDVNLCAEDLGVSSETVYGAVSALKRSGMVAED